MKGNLITRMKYLLLEDTSDKEVTVLWLVWLLCVWNDKKMMHLLSEMCDFWNIALDLLCLGKFQQHCLNIGCALIVCKWNWQFWLIISQRIMIFTRVRTVSMYVYGYWAFQNELYSCLGSYIIIGLSPWLPYSLSCMIFIWYHLYGVQKAWF